MSEANGAEPPDAEHAYLSLECYHGQCGVCPMACRVCWVRCLCLCHRRAV